ncbi:DUF1206 domain-containing protein [Ruania halotolerans]|uniref:DUF1206 domain-containing protein n=1 Tax=Ruania halotolerans TaxID=2897773 RepID=UPI001E5EB919|nr:DUF1206 domain-containing protein [Ruania halotolerans]UFU06079.1 DUF1206 domain-containing protein [Ruania halotolerans]
MTEHSPERAARDVADNPWMERLARAGFVASGLIHLMVGALAIQIALGGGGEADSGGALQALGSAPGGAILLWICTIGILALALFQILAVVAGGGGAGDRIKVLGKGVLYGALGVSALQYATGSGGSGGESTTSMTGRLMQLPFGPILVAVVGAAVIGVGIYHVHKGWTRGFLKDLRAPSHGTLGRGITGAGMAGYIAKGVALVIVGALFCLAAWQSDPDEATGLDGALKTLAGQPFGTALLLAVAVGLILYGVYSIARARYARMD